MYLFILLLGWFYFIIMYVFFLIILFFVSCIGGFGFVDRKKRYKINVVNYYL